MKTILIPTDFSETSKNAARYAIHFAKELGFTKLVLFNAHERYIETDPTLLVTVPDFSEGAMQASTEALEKFKNDLLLLVDAGMEIETYSQYTFLTDAINEIAKKFDADYVVMGVTGGDKLTEAFMGSFAIDVAKVSEVPVIIVPPNTSFTPIEEVMLACDFKNIEKTTPVSAITHLLDETKAKLFVLNVDKDNKPFTPETPMETETLDDLLKGYEPEYHYMNGDDYVEAINKFALARQVDLIITIPKKHGLFEGLFKKSHTKMLAFHSHVPLMIIHES